VNLTSPLRPIVDVPRILRHGKASRDEIVAFQERRLRQIVRHAYERVPYYRRLFDDARIKPDDIRTIADLHVIPVTTKETLRALARDDLTARGVNPNRLIRHESNGSTGIPVTVFRQRAEAIALAAMHRRARWEVGIERGYRVATVNWRSRGATAVPRKQHRGLRNKLWGIESSTRIDCALPVEEIAKQLKEARPEVIVGYPSVLSLVAAHLGEGQTEVRPKHVITVSEVVTPAMRARMDSVFRAPVRDVYSCWELALIAHECGAGGNYHVCDDNLILEVLRDGQPVSAGEAGEVVGTSLNYAAMPFIRYELGDVVTRGPERCGCGSPFSTLAAIQGRVVDYFPLPDGRVLHPYTISAIIWETAFRCMRQYQLVQERTDRITAYVALASEHYRDDVSAEMCRVETLLGPGVELVVEFVEEIPAGPRGKFGVYRSLVRSEYA
jgi:phenylacetate-CoA ligase